jgi:histidinol-phosphate/aromatic aminotransferase/cobyric acid decarboxylase-like protein
MAFFCPKLFMGRTMMPRLINACDSFKPSMVSLNRMNKKLVCESEMVQSMLAHSFNKYCLPSVFVASDWLTNAEGKQYLLNECANMDCTISDSQTNFLFIRFNETIDGLKLSQALIKRGIIVRPMKSFGQKNAIRVTIGTLEQNKRFIKELTTCLNQSLLE